MPYDLIRISPRRYSVVNSDTGVIHAKHSILKNAKAQIRLLNSLKGGKLKGKEIDQFVKGSYEDRKGKTTKIGEYELDKSLSNATVKVYHDPKTGKTVVANRGTKSTSLSDWTNNMAYAVGLYDKTGRYKQAEETQKKAIAKYGKDSISNVGHSQGAIITRKLKDKGLTNELINVNPASKGEKVRKGETVIKSSGDVVSALVPKGKRVKVIRAKSYNPLTEHSSSILEGDERVYGNGLVSIGQVPDRRMVGRDPSTYTPRGLGGCMGCMGMCGGGSGIVPTIYDNALPSYFPKRYS